MLEVALYYIYSSSLLLTGLLLVNVVFSYQSKHIDPQFWSTLKFQLLALPLFLTANLCIGYGIKLGYKAVGSLGYVLLASKGLEMFISLLMGFIFLRESPSWRTWAGLAIVLIGFVVAKGK
jgi:drug/metabolite transporter (DMT)-like permease